MNSSLRVYGGVALGTVVLASIAVLTFASCTSTQSHDGGTSTAQLEWDNFYRGTASRGDDGYGGKIDRRTLDKEETKYVNQNWGDEERELSYREAQGSHIVPIKFAMALEKADSGKPFFSSDNMVSYGFIPQNPGPLNPYGLPVGFTIDGQMGFGLTGAKQLGKRYLGVNCALCHTSDLRYNGKRLRIDGGQTLARFQDFVRDMDMAMKATREDGQKLERFLNRVVAYKKPYENPAEPFIEDKAKLLQEFDEALAVRGDWTNLNDANHNYGHGFNDTKFQHGPGRIDAFAVIFNQVLARDMGIPSNAGEPNAPVSPPVVWDAPQHDFVQWNGLASNDPNNGGPLARNVGQVLGVFGRVDLHSETGVVHGYCSTPRRTGLDKLEKWIEHLWSPLWPEDFFPPLDRVKFAQGRRLFEQQCLKCHQDIVRDDPDRKIKAKLIPMKAIGTETKFNDNALSRVVQSAFLKGKMTRLKEGRPLEDTEPGATVLKHIVAGAIGGTIAIKTCVDSTDVDPLTALKRWGVVLGKAIPLVNYATAQEDDNPDKDLRISALVKKLAVYKARPLNGIWASPPFLHNGSVKSLYDLLLPPEQRKSFWLGCNDYDPVKAGLDCKEGNGNFYFDTTINGNQPVGHDYGPRGENAEADRMALVEYLKSI